MTSDHEWGKLLQWEKVQAADGTARELPENNSERDTLINDSVGVSQVFYLPYGSGEQSVSSSST